MPEATSREAPLRVLIVDDDPDLCEVLSDALNDAGFQSAACSTAEEALDRLRAGSFFALLTDQVMPDMTGVDLVKQALSVDSQLRCIVLSGYTRPEGVDVTWFRKPVDANALVTALRRAN